MKKLIKKIVGGNRFPNEYLCINKTNYEKPFSVYLVSPVNGEKSDISSAHFLLGYKPLLIGVKKNALQNFHTIVNETKFIVQFYFESELKAEIKTVSINPKPEFENEILILKGTDSWHSFQSLLQKKISRANEFFSAKSPANIYLNPRLYNQVRIMYCIPRIIALAIVKQDNKYNVFPTDLHGRISKEIYMDSLRINHKACEQVLSCRHLVIAFMPAEMYQAVYSLGNRHHKDFCDEKEFNFGSEKSKLSGLRLPAGYNGYMELEVLQTQAEGIHNLFYLRILHEMPQHTSSVLAHIHSLAANWRERKKIPTSYLIR